MVERAHNRRGSTLIPRNFRNHAGYFLTQGFCNGLQLAEVRHGTIESNDFLAGETQEVLSLQSRRSLEEM